MKLVLFVFYKEFLGLKSSRITILRLILQSLVYGLLLPLLYYLILTGALPIEFRGVAFSLEQRAAMVKLELETFLPLILPFFISVVTSLFSTPSFAMEVENRTLERLLSLPLLWVHVVAGKVLFNLAISLACAYLIVISYFTASHAIVDTFRPPNLAAYGLLLVPAVALYTVSAALFASARARSVRSANVTAGFLTWGLFLGFFFLSWILGLKPNEDSIVLFSIFLLVTGAKLIAFIIKTSPEKLLYGR